MAKAGTNFFDLPAELRNHIYELALRSPNPVIVDHQSFKRRKLRVRGLLVVNQQLRAEAVPVFYGINAFEATFYSTATRFPDCLGRDKVVMLRTFRAVARSLSASTRLQTWLVHTGKAVERCRSHYSRLGLNEDALYVYVGARCGAEHEQWVPGTTFMKIHVSADGRKLVLPDVGHGAKGVLERGKV